MTTHRDMPAPPADAADLEFAVETVRRAGEFTQTYFKAAELEIISKADGSPVTAVDRGAEQMMRDLITARHPDDTVLGEENGVRPGTSSRRWVIDPIDGTVSFTHGVALYTNLLYLEDEHGPAIGVINVPALGEMIWAGRGLGCYLNGLRCSVSDRDDPVGGVISASAYEHWDGDMLDRVRRSGMRMRTWGDGYGYLLVASGRIQAMVDPAIHFWDIAPCLVVIAEAGGTLTQLDGTRPAEPTSCVATNGLIHDALLDILNG
ncbi:MAG: inositol monophosphatase family protein [Microthrixaceae bacterium]